MKKIYTLVTVISILVISYSQAQWSTDPDNPGIVSDYQGLQYRVHAFADDNGGVFVFWLDSRNNLGYGERDIYGQHFDADGYALWEEDGRQIIQHYHKINNFDVLRDYNQEIIIGWITKSHLYPYSDSLRFQRIDNDGLKVWGNDLLVSNAAASPNSILSVDDFDIIHNNSGYCLALDITYYGGSNGNRLTKFNSDGVLTGNYDGIPLTASYGNSELVNAFDSGDNMYLFYSSGNGAGAALNCLKTDPQGNSQWGPVNVLDGTSGLSYQFAGISDESGITFIWQGNGVNVENIYARRYNPDGSTGWNGTTLTICDANGSQANFFVKKSGSQYFITWNDGRPGVDPGNFDIYAQKFDVNGNIYWQNNGIEVTSLSTYLPHPKLEFTDDNAIIVCHQATIYGFVAQKVTDNGNLVWDENGNLICTTQFSPFYEEHIELRSGANLIAVWMANNGDGNIYITRIDQSGTIGDQDIPVAPVSVYPNPAKDVISIGLQENKDVSAIFIDDSFGRRIFYSEPVIWTTEGTISLDLPDLSPGLYFLEIKGDNETVIRKLLIE